MTYRAHNSGSLSATLSNPENPQASGSSIGMVLEENNSDMRLTHEPVDAVISLLAAAANQLPQQEREAHSAIREAVSLLRRVVEPHPAQQLSSRKGGFLAWQEYKIVQYINAHVADRICVTHLCALLGLSEGHFSRLFTITFGKSPHAFVVGCRLELAIHHMLHTDASLSDIALVCGFSDQAHLCRRFRDASGQTPAAWRRARRVCGEDAAAPTRSRRGAGNG